MRNTTDTLAWLKKQHTSGSSSWRALCLSLARQARGLPGVYPSALAAQHATPREHRVYDLDKVKRGMVAYFDDPSDGNPYGHITTVIGRNKAGELLHWTNDASGPGRVSVVRHSFFPNYWGDKFQFAATWLNGYELDLPDGKKKPEKKPEKRPNLDHAIEDIKKAIAAAKKDDSRRLVKALERDLRELQQTKKRFR